MRRWSERKTMFSLLREDALQVQLKDPVRRIALSKMANLWCMWASSRRSTTTGTPAALRDAASAPRSSSAAVWSSVMRRTSTPRSWARRIAAAMSSSVRLNTQIHTLCLASSSCLQMAHLPSPERARLRETRCGKKWAVASVVGIIVVCSSVVTICLTHFSMLMSSSELIFSSAMRKMVSRTQAILCGSRMAPRSKAVRRSSPS
mmetsp:Transcript_11459/g.36606  ORF Transcript_11459/g.36606 Transcript_11459/m.36606 type:complete len:204 (+) Transcript_11459:249-860(+)